MAIQWPGRPMCAAEARSASRFSASTMPHILPSGGTGLVRDPPAQSRLHRPPQGQSAPRGHRPQPRRCHPARRVARGSPSRQSSPDWGASPPCGLELRPRVATAGNPAVCCCAGDGGAASAPGPLSGECARGSGRTCAPPLPACGFARPPGRSASAESAPRAG